MGMPMRYVAGMVLIAGLAACAPAYEMDHGRAAPVGTAALPAATRLNANNLTFEVQRDRFAPLPWSVASADVTMPEVGGHGLVSFNARKTTTGELFHVDAHVIYDGDWRNYSTARMPGGAFLETRSLDKNVIHCSPYTAGCTLSETVRVFLTRDQFLAGGEIQISGNGAMPFVVWLPPDVAAKVAAEIGVTTAPNQSI